MPLSDLAVDDQLRAAIDDAVASGWWSMGPRVAELEQRFAALCEVRHAIAVSSGTAALHLSLLAIGCGPGDEVILPSLTFVAAANMVLAVGATPVFCDVTGEHDLNLSIDDVRRRITPSSKALLLVHYGGHPCDMDGVMQLAAEHGLHVIEDAAHAPGARWKGRPCGGIGALGCFSFFSNKNLPVGEGGMVTTEDDELAERVRLGRSHGMTTLTWDRHRGHAAGYDVLAPGYNYRLDELRAAIGIVQLDRLLEANATRARHVEHYRKALAGIDGITVPFAPDGFDGPDGSGRDGCVPAHHLQVVLLPSGTDRDALRVRLTEAGVQTSVHYPPIHRFTAYRDLGAHDMPVTDAIADRLLTLPLYPHMTNEQVELVSSALARAMETLA